MTSAFTDIKVFRLEMSEQHDLIIHSVDNGVMANSYVALHF